MNKTVKISEFVGKDDLAVVLKLPDKNKSYSLINKYKQLYSSFTYPSETLMLTKLVLASSDDKFYIATWVPDDERMRSFSSYVSDNMELILVSEKESKAFKKKYENCMLANLPIHLSHNFTIGSDPEIFVEDENGNCIPAYEFLGSKEKPDRTPGGTNNTNAKFAVFNVTGGNSMYWDGFQAEFTTLANTCMEYHTDSIASGLRGVRDAAKAKFPKSRLSIRSVFDIPFETLQSANEEHVAFGCMPSINAYGLRANMPYCREVPFRSAGGHIHFGIGKTTEEKAIPIVMALDAILGVACVSLFASFDDPKRRIMYGLPGEFRLPPHGLEYRPLSNAWMCHPFITNLVFDLARKCVRFGQLGLLKYWEGNQKETIDCMVSCDVDKSREILNRNKNLFINLLKSAYPAWPLEKDYEKMFSIFIDGLESVIEDPSNFEVNWGMTDDQPWRLRCQNRNVKGMFNLLSKQKLAGDFQPNY